MYISTAQGNQPRRDLNVWTKLHGLVEQDSNMLLGSALLDCCLLSGHVLGHA